MIFLPAQDRDGTIGASLIPIVSGQALWKMHREDFLAAPLVGGSDLHAEVHRLAGRRIKAASRRLPLRAEGRTEA
jgi:hypothetical protein